MMMFLASIEGTTEALKVFGRDILEGIRRCLLYCS